MNGFPLKLNAEKISHHDTLTSPLGDKYATSTIVSAGCISGVSVANQIGGSSGPSPTSASSFLPSFPLFMVQPQSQPQRPQIQMQQQPQLQQVQPMAPMQPSPHMQYKLVPVCTG